MTEEQEFRSEVMQALAELQSKESAASVSSRQFRKDSMEAFCQITSMFREINDAMGVLRIALEMLCAKHGDDPEVLMEAARKHVKEKLGK